MKKKVAIWIVVILVIALLVGGTIMLLRQDNNGNDNTVSGDVSGENLEVVDKNAIEYIDPVEDYVIFGLLETDKLNKYSTVQELRLEENEIKEYFWTMRAEGLENISIDSGETEFLYSEHGVGTVVNRVYKITGLKEGTAILRFNATYRPLADMEPIQSQTVIYRVDVNADKQVAITEETRFIPTEDFMGHEGHENVENVEHNHEH